MVQGTNCYRSPAVFAIPNPYTNTTRGTELHLSEWDSDEWDIAREVHEPKRTTVFVFDLTETGEPGWRKKSGSDDEVLTTADLSKYAVKRLADLTLERKRRQRGDY